MHNLPGYTLEDLPHRIKIAGGLNNMVKNEAKVKQTMASLEAGEFINKENSNFLITLIKDYGWKVEFSPLK